jgi:hypothetical protein
MSDHLTSRLRDAPLREATSRHELMMAEARRIIDAGNDQGVILRLTGGLAVRHYAIDLEFAEREYSDIDLIGLKRQTTEIHQVFLALGYQENIHVAMATGNSQRQYFKPQHALESRTHMSKRAHATPVMSAIPPSDHIDVFLDAMKMDHELDFRDRLEINTYAVDPADIFLSKLQIVNLSEKDAHDVITLCKDVYVDFHEHPGVLDLEHVAETCAGDWGLYIDVMSNIDRVLERLDDYDLSPVETNRIARTLELAQDMMTEHSKSLRWRMRARIGKRLRWYNDVDETFGGRAEEPGAGVRTKEGRAAGPDAGPGPTGPGTQPGAARGEDEPV